MYYTIESFKIGFRKNVTQHSGEDLILKNLLKHFEPFILIFKIQHLKEFLTRLKFAKL